MPASTAPGSPDLRKTGRGKSLTATIALVLFLSARFPLAAFAADESKVEVFGDWKVVCDAGECRAQQDIYDPESLGITGRSKAAPIAKLILWRRDGALTIKIEGPLNMALEAGMALLTDGKVLLLLPYQSCQSTCVASAQLDEHMMVTIAGAERIQIAMGDLTGKPFYYSVSAAGCGDALQALGMQTGDTPGVENMVVHPGDAQAH